MWLDCLISAFLVQWTSFPPNLYQPKLEGLTHLCMLYENCFCRTVTCFTPNVAELTGHKMTMIYVVYSLPGSGWTSDSVLSSWWIYALPVSIVWVTFDIYFCFKVSRIIKCTEIKELNSGIYFYVTVRYKTRWFTFFSWLLKKVFHDAPVLKYVTSDIALPCSLYSSGMTIFFFITEIIIFKLSTLSLTWLTCNEQHWCLIFTTYTCPTLVYHLLAHAHIPFYSF